MDIGSFELLEAVGRGGMGAVWRARHRPSGVAVAVKVLQTDPRAEATWFEDTPEQPLQMHEALRREVRTAAALRHAGIVSVYDCGSVPESLQEGAGGTEWLAMELMTGGTLEQLGGVGQQWPPLRDAVLRVLDALAHAHARGVLHLDLKPSNVLFAGTQPKLADFGIARLQGELRRGIRAEGTPVYMSPEQIRADWRDFGPATDLFALGATVWGLVTGESPFSRERLQDRALAVPRSRSFQPLFAVPSGLKRWLTSLMQPDVDARCASAPEAAEGLRDLEPVGPDVEPGRSASPERWREPPVPRPPEELLCGLALFGMRAIPMVGRDAACELLWNGLEQVIIDRSVRGVVLHGVQGVGKTRLARWIGLRAEELGVGSAIEVGAEGVSEAIRRELKCDGLSGAALQVRVQRWVRCRRLSAAVGEAIVDVLERPESVAIATAASVLAAVARGLAGSPDPGRPDPNPHVAVVILDGVSSTRELVDLARALMQQSHLPALVVMTLRSDDDRRLGLTAAGLTEVAVPPLSTAAHRELVWETLGLRGQPAVDLEQRTAGNPELAIQVLRSWLERGEIKPTQMGFALVPGAVVRVAPDLDAVWAERVERVLQGQPEGVRAALELAAVLGTEVVGRVWRAACECAGISATHRRTALAVLVNADLVLQGRRSGRFVHPSMVAALCRSAEAAGRLRDHHAAAAMALDSDKHPWRYAEHVAACGDKTDEADAWLAAAPALYAAGRLFRLKAALDRAAECLADVDPTDPRWDRVRLFRVRHAMYGRKNVDATRALLWENEALPQTPHRVALGLLIEVWLATIDLGPSGAMACAQRSIAATPLDSELYGDVQQMSARLCLRVGERDRALSQALDLSRHETPRWRAMGFLIAGDVCSDRGEPVLARAYYERAMSVAIQARRRRTQVGISMSLAALERRTGRHEVAARALDDARQWSEITGDWMAIRVIDVNRALLHLSAGEFASAEALLERFLGLTQAAWDRGCALAFLLPCLAARQDWAKLEKVLEESRNLMGQIDGRDVDVADALDLAVSLCEDRPDLSVRLRDFAKVQRGVPLA